MKSINNKHIELDDSQKPIVETEKGYHLVLASPGCGKTHILAERVRYAYQQGVKVEDMLCLTFTNRAAREMNSRIRQVITDEEIEKLQVGNVHHFCAKFLFDENKVEADASIIDDEEAVSIIANFKDEDEQGILENYNRNKTYQEIIFFSHLMYQIEKQHPRDCYLHPESFTEDDKTSLRIICNLEKIAYNRETLIQIYRNVETYMGDEDILSKVEWSQRNKIRQMYAKMYYALCYEQYKQTHNMLDFEDLLLYTYDIYKKDDACKRYVWIQVDEVQDLNAMQLAIIDLLTDKSDPMVMFLGDEQQAIFSFMGAKVETLMLLKERCKSNIHHLQKNHRSPKYLLDIFNEYAEKQLGINRDLLPITDDTSEAPPANLRILASSSVAAEVMDIAQLTKQLSSQNKDETTAIIVNANADADNVSQGLDEADLKYFKVSGRDMFNTTAMKTLIAHLTITVNEHNFLAWTRLLKGLKVFESNTLARRFVYRLKQLGISPTDFLLYEHNTYVADFLSLYENEEFVVFDTETTGLNVYEDDIIEIAAIRIKKGEIVGEPLDIYMQTPRPILQHLGANENPLYDIYHSKLLQNQLLSPKEGLTRFLAYVGDATLIAHNADYDVHIMQQNLHRHFGNTAQSLPNRCFDSLKLIRLLDPKLKSYKLEALLKYYHLAGENSHKAIDDVKATVNLVKLCAEKAADRIDNQKTFIEHPNVKKYIRKLQIAYKEIFMSAHTNRYIMIEGTENALTRELKKIYNQLRDEKRIDEINRMDYVLNYIDLDMITDQNIPNTLEAQLGRYMLEISTMKESDFCKSKSLKERIYVTTIHKAKGLEFDNVIIFDAVNGRFPNAYNRGKRFDDEDARKFYVALSRAKRRLYIAYSLAAVNRYGEIYSRELTPFMDTISRFFN